MSICPNERPIYSVLLNYNKGLSCMKDLKIAQRIRSFDFLKVVHIYHCPRKYFTVNHQNQVCCALVYMFQQKIHRVLLEGYHEGFKNCPIPKSCPHKASKLVCCINWYVSTKNLWHCVQGKSQCTLFKCSFDW